MGENLASTIGNQYIREGAVFAHNVKPGGFFWEMLKTQPPGTSDTSRIATDHINNPNAINPIFELGARLSVAEEEEVAGDSLNLPGVTAKMKVPHVLKDGADSVGVPGATLRVYVNIGSYSQHWLEQHNALIGLTPQSLSASRPLKKIPFIGSRPRRSSRTSPIFSCTSNPTGSEDAPGGKDYITTNESVMTRGKNCIRGKLCHPSFEQAATSRGGMQRNGSAPKCSAGFSRQQFLFGRPSVSHHENPEQCRARALGTNAKRGHITRTPFRQGVQKSAGGRRH